MKIDGTPYRSVWVDQEDGWTIRIFDQTRLPWALEILRLSTPAHAAHAIRAMQTRGAPLIGAVAAYGMCLAMRADPSREALERDAAILRETRPTAVNLAWAVERMLGVLRGVPDDHRGDTESGDDCLDVPHGVTGERGSIASPQGHRAGGGHRAGVARQGRV